MHYLTVNTATESVLHKTPESKQREVAFTQEDSLCQDVFPLNLRDLYENLLKKSRL